MRVYLVFILALLPTLAAEAQKVKLDKPNIIIIYVDDLGYGDIGVNGAIGVKTPNVDFLARNGLNFTDAHSSASTCTPSRFSLLTGSYAFRNAAAILPGDAPLLIRPGTPTLPGMLQQAGYTTAVIGKWHLGLGDGKPDWNTELKPGPLEIGFDYSFIIPATLDRVPTVFVENHQVVGLDHKDLLEVNYNHKIGDLPTGLDHPEMLKVRADTQHSGTIVDSISRIGYMTGGASAYWQDGNIAKVLTGKVNDFVRQNSHHPFFLYYSLTGIHVPHDPNIRFKGNTAMGSRGDAIAEMDWSVGEVIKMLEESRLTDNTIILFTSDNGPVLDDGYEDGAEELLGDHKPWGPFRGGKYSAYEAGTRMPTIVYFPSQVKPGKTGALICQVDWYASLAKLVGFELAPNAAPDSYELLSVLLGRSARGRTSMLEEAFTLALRNGKWKYIAPQTKKTPDWLANKKIETGLKGTPQLFDLNTDWGEKYNIIQKNPRVAKKMKKMLDHIENTATRPGFQTK